MNSKMDPDLRLDDGQSLPPPPSSLIIYGTAWKKEKTSACVELALSTGFRGVDTACQPKHYFEPGVGEGIAKFLDRHPHLTRDDLYIQTKFTPLSGQDPNQIPYDPRAPLEEQVMQSFQASQKNLRTDVLDCLVLHSPLQGQAMMTVWNAMQELVDRGVVRALGLSNCYDPEFFGALYEWSRIKPKVLQNRFYEQTGYDQELRAFCRERGISYQSFWTLTANQQLLSHSVVTGLASKHVRTPAQILFRYLTQESVTPLTGTQSEAHMREDLSIFEFELTEVECASITKLLTGFPHTRE